MRARVLMGASVALALAVAGCGPKSADDSSATAPATPAAPVLSAAEKQTLLASLPAPYNTGDLANGEKRFALCRSCHTINEGGAKLTGPNLYGVFGRKAGSLPGFNYSEALKSANFNWEATHLDQWLADPRGYMPGTKMSFAGIKAPKDRLDLIAYLKVETGYRP